MFVVRPYTHFSSCLSSYFFLGDINVHVNDEQAMADIGELEGIDKAIAWVKNIYIFGLFEGETGEEAPWYLKPVRRLAILG